MNIEKLLRKFIACTFIPLLAAPAFAQTADAPLETTLQPGSMLVAHDTPVIVHMGSGDINIASGSVVYLLSLDDEVAVLTLDNKTKNDVNVQIGEKNILVPLRKELVFAPEQRKFEETTLSKYANSTNPKLVDSPGDMNVFVADFSYIAALDNCVQFQSMVNSKSTAQEKIAACLIKLAAAFNKMTGDDGEPPDAGTKPAQKQQKEQKKQKTDKKSSDNQAEDNK